MLLPIFGALPACGGYIGVQQPGYLTRYAALDSQDFYAILRRLLWERGKVLIEDTEAAYRFFLGTMYVDYDPLRLQDAAYYALFNDATPDEFAASPPQLTQT